MEDRKSREALTWVLPEDDTRGGGLVVAVQLRSVDVEEEQRARAGVNLVHLEQHPRVELHVFLVQPQSGVVGRHNLHGR